MFRPCVVRTGRQIKAARAMLAWKQTDLARTASIHKNAVAYWERAPVIPPPHPSGRPNRREPDAVKRMRGALKAVGVRFVIEPAAGVCFVAQ